MNYIFFSIFLLIGLMFMELHEKSAKSTWKKGWLWHKDLKFLNAFNKYIDRKDPNFPDYGWRRKYYYEWKNGKWNLVPNKRPKWMYLWLFEPKWQERKYGSTTFRSSLYTGEKMFQRNMHVFIAISFLFINVYCVYLYIGTIYFGGAIKEALKKYNLFTE